MTLNDFEPLKGDFSKFFAIVWLQRTFQEWIATKCLKIDQDNLRMKFLALHADFSSLSANPLCSSRPAHASVKNTPLKIVILLIMPRLA